jgi:hypothetical protein
MNSSIFSSEAGKFIFRIVLPYLAIMGVICFALDGWFARTIIFSAEDEGPAKIHHYFATNDPDEVPIFGNSRTNHALDPTVIAPSSWNYGINGSDSELLRFLLEQELGRNRTTPILIGMDPDFLLLNRFGDEPLPGCHGLCPHVPPSCCVELPEGAGSSPSLLSAAYPSILWRI